LGYLFKVSKYPVNFITCVKRIFPGALELSPVKNPAGVKAFGEHLRRLRLERNWSLQELAYRADIALLTVHRTETAKFAATIDILLSLARAFEMPLKELVDCAEIENANAVSDVEGIG
jgi:ribosome-binding protein aMBF1 (putative translation factor)